MTNIDGESGITTPFYMAPHSSKPLPKGVGGKVSYKKYKWIPIPRKVEYGSNPRLFSKGFFRRLREGDLQKGAARFLEKKMPKLYIANQLGKLLKKSDSQKYTLTANLIEGDIVLFYIRDAIIEEDKGGIALYGMTIEAPISYFYRLAAETFRKKPQKLRNQFVWTVSRAEIRALKRNLRSLRLHLIQKRYRNPQTAQEHYKNAVRSTYSSSHIRKVLRPDEEQRYELKFLKRIDGKKALIRYGASSDFDRPLKVGEISAGGITHDVEIKEPIFIADDFGWVFESYSPWGIGGYKAFRYKQFTIVSNSGLVLIVDERVKHKNVEGFRLSREDLQVFRDRIQYWREW